MSSLDWWSHYYCYLVIYSKLKLIRPTPIARPTTTNWNYRAINKILLLILQFYKDGINNWSRVSWHLMPFRLTTESCWLGNGIRLQKTECSIHHINYNNILSINIVMAYSIVNTSKHKRAQKKGHQRPWCKRHGGWQQTEAARGRLWALSRRLLWEEAHKRALCSDEPRTVCCWEHVTCVCDDDLHQNGCLQSFVFNWTMRNFGGHRLRRSCYVMFNRQVEGTLPVHKIFFPP